MADQRRLSTAMAPPNYPSQPRLLTAAPHRPAGERLVNHSAASSSARSVANVLPPNDALQATSAPPSLLFALPAGMVPLAGSSSAHAPPRTVDHQSTGGEQPTNGPPSTTSASSTEVNPPTSPRSMGRPHPAGLPTIVPVTLAASQMIVAPTTVLTANSQAPRPFPHQQALLSFPHQQAHIVTQNGRPTVIIRILYPSPHEILEARHRDTGLVLRAMTDADVASYLLHARYHEVLMQNPPPSGPRDTRFIPILPPTVGQLQELSRYVANVQKMSYQQIYDLTTANRVWQILQRDNNVPQ